MHDRNQIPSPTEKEVATKIVETFLAENGISKPDVSRLFKQGRSAFTDALRDTEKPLSRFFKARFWLLTKDPYFRPRDKADERAVEKIPQEAKNNVHQWRASKDLEELREETLTTKSQRDIRSLEREFSEMLRAYADFIDGKEYTSPVPVSAEALTVFNQPPNTEFFEFLLRYTTLKSMQFAAGSSEHRADADYLKTETLNLSSLLGCIFSLEPTEVLDEWEKNKKKLSTL